MYAAPSVIPPQAQSHRDNRRIAGVTWRIVGRGWPSVFPISHSIANGEPSTRKKAHGCVIQRQPGQLESSWRDDFRCGSINVLQMYIPSKAAEERERLRTADFKKKPEKETKLYAVYFGEKSSHYSIIYFSR